MITQTLRANIGIWLGATEKANCEPQSVVNVVWRVSHSKAEVMLLNHIYGYFVLSKGYNFTRSLSQSAQAHCVTRRFQSDKLLEGTVDRRAKISDTFVEVDGGHSTLRNALGCELEFL